MSVDQPRSDVDMWDKRYACEEFVWSTTPNRFLAPAVAGLEPGTALDVACGEGRNAVWLATEGWQVTGVDFSRSGIDKAVSLAAAASVECEWICADVVEWRPPAQFDLVIVFYLHLAEAQRRAAMSSAAHAVAPGGMLLIVGHDLANLTDGTGGPQSADVLYTPADIVDDLRSAQVVGLDVVRAETVRRPVETETGQRDALDCLVQARRSLS